MKFFYSVIQLIAFTILSAISLQAQDAVMDETDVQANYKASYLFNFAKYCDWPELYKKGEFVIAVAGNAAVSKELQEKYKGKPIGSQTLVVKTVSATDKPEGVVHILFVSRAASKDLAQFVKNYKKMPTMIVCEQDGALDSGAFINFKAVDAVLKFEVNDSRAKEAGVLIGDILKGWALNIK